MWRRWLWSVDRTILTSVSLSLVIGFLCIVKISIYMHLRFGVPPLIFCIKHGANMIVAMLLGFFLSRTKKENILKTGTWIFTISLIMTLLTLFMGPKINGVRRWLRLPGFTIQASEYMKTFIVFPLARLICVNWKMAIGVMFSSIILCALQPDLGMSFLIIMVAFVVFWYQDKYVDKFYKIIGIGLILLLFSGVFLATYALKRILIFIGREKGFQITRALMSFSNSAILGEGVHVYIPDSHCDFIFAEICNNFGLIIGIFIILQPVILWSTVKKHLSNLDVVSKLTAIGLTLQIAIQTYYHILSNLALVPTKGVTLPFYSYGGSSLITHVMSIGLLLAITRKI